MVLTGQKLSKAEFLSFYSVSSLQTLSRQSFTKSKKTLLSAAHFYATKWEFDIIERADPGGYEITQIKERLQKKQEEYYDLKGIDQLAKHSRCRDFINLCGQLRFKKSIEGLDDLIKEYEREQMEKEIYGLIPDVWHNEIRMFTENEFDSVVTVNNGQIKVSSQEISEKYNTDEFDPRDGEIVKAAESLGAFIEAYSSIRNGSSSEELHQAKVFIKNRYERVNIAGINIGEIYADFD
jgi:hypothetical protein